MDALELLRKDHDKVRDLFEHFESAKEAEDVDRMSSLQQQIFTELELHTTIEEEVFYPAAQEVGGEAEELVHEGVEEHHVVEVLMSEIRQLDPSADAWAAKMTVLIENVEHHAEEEEDELFPKLREAFGNEKLAEMGEQLENAKRRHQHDGKSKQELYQEAQDKDVPGRSQMTKDELQDAVDED